MITHQNDGRPPQATEKKYSKMMDRMMDDRHSSRKNKQMMDCLQTKAISQASTTQQYNYKPNQQHTRKNGKVSSKSIRSILRVVQSSFVGIQEETTNP